MATGQSRGKYCGVDIPPPIATMGPMRINFKTDSSVKLISSIKHDLARSCFQLWPKIGDEGDKISRKKTGEALAETVFSRNFVTLGADFEGHN